MTQSYWLGKTVVTQAQWKAVMGANPSHNKHSDKENYPVESISWSAAMEFCARLNKMYGRKLPPGYEFSLPTEAQWEYACRAGTTTALNNGKNLMEEGERFDPMNEVGWYVKNSYLRTFPVAKKRPNAWGFYDMHGNVTEWCFDWYDEEYGCGTNDATDPIGPTNGTKRVWRGGNYRVVDGLCRSAYRGEGEPDHVESVYGFRLALAPVRR